MVNRKRLLIGCSVFAIIALVAGCIVLKIAVTQSWSAPCLAKFRSPAIRGDEVWLFEEGFVGRGLSLFVVCSRHGNTPIAVTRLDWEGLYYFSSFQWTEDGRVAVFTVQGTGAPETPSFAYDFEKGKAILPPWQGVCSTNQMPDKAWKEFQQIVASLIKSHGGLRGEPTRLEAIRNRSEKIWYWQIPQRNQVGATPE